MSGSLATGIANSPMYRAIGIILAVLSGILIGVSFIFKKKGLISSRDEDGSDDNHAYLKSTMWWLGMILMALGEITNFIAYALAPAVLVTPLGALSVVVSAVFSSIFLKEKLNFHGKLGCFICLLGVITVVMHAPEQNAPDEIDKFMKLALAPGFLVYTVLIIIGSVILVWKVAPKYGKRHPIIYISICSFIGSLSVCTLQALGGAIIRTFYGDNQFTHWFIYVLIVFVLVTILTQINFLNKALNEFVTAEVTPIYYVVFTTATIVSSAILYQGFKASAVSIATLIFAFFTICSGVVILQTSRMYEALRTAEESLMPTPHEKTSNVMSQECGLNLDATVLEMTTPISMRSSINPSLSNVRCQEGDIENFQASPIESSANYPTIEAPSRHPSFSRPVAIPHYLNANLRTKSSQSSIQSSGSITTVMQRIGVAMNPEAFDHLKPRTIFSDNQLEETGDHPLSTSIRPLSVTSSQSGWEIRNSPVDRLTPKVTPRAAVVVTDHSDLPPRPIIRTTSSPSIRSTKPKPGHMSLSASETSNPPDPSRSQFNNIGAINEEPETFATPLLSPALPHSHNHPSSSHRSSPP